MDHLRYDQLDWRAKRNEDVDQATKWLMIESTACQIHQRQIHRQPKIHLEKLSLSMNRSKFQCISQDRLYAELYGPKTLQFWYKKDNVPLDLLQILWEESRLARKRMALGQR